jgi:superfamily II DNA/RNA helicase
MSRVSIKVSTAFRVYDTHYNRSGMPKTKTTPDYDTPPSHDIPPVDSFEDLGLDGRVLSGIRDMGFSTPTEIQRKALPYTLAGYDLIGQRLSL